MEIVIIQVSLEHEQDIGKLLVELLCINAVHVVKITDADDVMFHTFYVKTMRRKVF